jgi:membrane protease YdiL (CAAX protease family)
MRTESSRAQAVPWTTRDVWLGLALLILLGVAASAGAFLTRSLVLGLNLGLIVALGELVLLVPVWWFAVRKYPVGWEILGLRGFQGQALGLGCGLMVFSFIFNFLYASFLALFGLSIQIDLVPIFAQLSSPWLLLVGGVVVAPVVEEVFFRGFVFAGLRPGYGWRWAAVISSGLFALIHFTPTAIIPIFFLGYIFAYLYHRSNSLWPAIMMHAATNALALGSAYLMANTDLFG